MSANKKHTDGYALLPGVELSRRGFLRSAGAATGGLLLGVLAPTGRTAASDGDDAELNAYIQIASSSPPAMLAPAKTANSPPN